MIEILILYLLLGCLAGLIAGLLGVGGGAVIVPALVVIFQIQSLAEANIMHLALGTSLATIVLTSISAVIAHHRRGAVVWRLVLWLAPGLGLGAVLGAMLADELSSEVLQRFFGLFEMVVALYMFVGVTEVIPREKSMTPPELLFVGTLIGGISSMLGIGGGTMTVPYLSWRRLVIQKAVAVSSACGFPIALAGCVGYLVAGLDASDLPPMATGYIYWPALAGISVASLLVAPVGAKLAHSLPVDQLKQLFAILLFLIGVAMLVFV